MKYQSSLPENNDNVSHNHPLKEFLILLAGLIAIVLAVFWVLGFFVDIAVRHISPEDESQLFSKLKFNLEAEKGEPSDHEKALQEITDSLRKCMEISYPVEVLLVESELANAAAYPGGKVIVFSGLLERMSSENGIAFVMAHELGHYINRDHLRSMGRGVVILALSAAITGANSDISRLLAPAETFGFAQYSQKQESSADRAALEGLNCYYGHAGGATELFEALKSEEGKFDYNGFHYFSSHPKLQKRIDDLNDTARAMGFQSKELTEF